MALIAVLLGSACVLALAAYCLRARRTPNGSDRSSGGAALVLVNKFDVVRIVSRTEAGELIEARDRSLGHAVAVRRVATGGDPEKRSRAMAAVRAAAAVQHPGFMRVFEILDDGNDVCVISEWPAGRTVTEMIAEAGPLPLSQAVTLLGQVCEALEAAHAKGVAHRLLGMGCLFVTGSGAVKIAGLGAAPHDAGDGRSADIRAVASMLYEMVTGAALPESQGTQATSEAAAGAGRAALPPALGALIQDALSPQPMPASAAEFLGRLRALSPPVTRRDS